MTNEPDANRVLYESAYDHRHLQIETAGDRHAAGMIRMRLDLLRRLAQGETVVDLGCGTGAYLLPAAAHAGKAIGIDYSSRFLRICDERLRLAGARNAHVALADLRAIPLSDASVGLVFSFATLYYVPQVELAIAELARILRPGGRAVLELGNVRSLNTIVARSVGGLRGYFLTPTAMRRVLNRSGLRVDECRVFQLLPMWGGPMYLRPLVTGHWRKVLGLSIAGKMLDEWISSLPFVRAVSFRHVLICTKLPDDVTSSVTVG